MGLETATVSHHFPRSAQYNPDWIRTSTSGGANALWLTEWLTSALELRPGMRVMDLGCGKAASSIFLRREFDVQVWATDLCFRASENWQRICDAGVDDGVFPIRTDARALPFANNFFDAIICIDSYNYYGSDDLYLNYLSRFVKPDGLIAIAGAGLTQDFDGPPPEHLREFWTQDLWGIHSAQWWSRHWQKTGIVNVELADAMPNGWELWLNWHQAMYPDNTAEINALELDLGRYLGYVRVVARRQGAVSLSDYCWPATMPPIPSEYSRAPLLRSSRQ